MEMWSITLKPSRRSARLHKLVDDRIHQRLERRVDDVRRDPDRRPTIAGFVGTLYQHARDGLGTGIEDTHTVIRELQSRDVALVFPKVLAQRKIECIDRTVTFGCRNQK